MTGRPVTIRPATNDDVEVLTELYQDGARHHESIDPVVHEVPEHVAAVERIRTKLSDDAKAVFLAESEGQAVGFVEIELVPVAVGSILRPNPTGRIGIAVRADERGRGIGTELMHFAERWAIEQHRTVMILDVSAANDGALRFYERLGYRTYGLLLRKSLEIDGTDLD